MNSYMLIYFTHSQLRASINLRLICVAQRQGRGARAWTKKGIGGSRNALCVKVRNLLLVVDYCCCCCIWQQLSAKSFSIRIPFPFSQVESGRQKRKTSTHYLYILSIPIATHTDTTIVYNSISVCNEFYFLHPPFPSLISRIHFAAWHLEGRQSSTQQHKQNDRQPHSVIHTFSLCVCV